MLYQHVYKPPGWWRVTIKVAQVKKYFVPTYPHRHVLAQHALEAPAVALRAAVVLVLVPFCLGGGLPASAASLT